MHELLDILGTVSVVAKFLGIAHELVQRGERTLGAVLSEGFAEELAGCAVLGGGYPFDLLGHLWGEADGEGAGCTGAGGHASILLRKTE